MLLDSLPHKCSIRRKQRQKVALGGSKDVSIEELSDVSCWEQQASASEIRDYEKRGVSISRKVYFTEDLQLTERHVIVMTERNGKAVAPQELMDVMSEPRPDASAGLGVLYRVMVNTVPGVSTVEGR